MQELPQQICLVVQLKLPLVNTYLYLLRLLYYLVHI